MKRFIESLVLVAFLSGMAIPSWGQAPSTEGRDFWVTFLQAQSDAAELILTISANEACDVTITNPNYPNFPTKRLHVDDNSSTSISITPKDACYSDDNETVINTALHVTATKDISLFAANYISKTFDAANVLPTTALLDDYIVQVYPPSDHGGDSESRGSHFAIVAVEDNTVVDYNLTAKTAANHTGTQTTPILNKGQVYYVWTGKGVGDAADLSGTTVKARNGKKIAVFQGCPHTNIPLGVRDRDHLFSQAMPIAYWGSEFGITASRQHRRDIVAVMALNDGTEVYINNADGEKELVHVFDFNVDTKHYWTFEIGEFEAYNTNGSTAYPTGPLPAPLVADSSCYLTSSCPVGVHLFMVSNKYDNESASGSNICDPAMLWISPIEQVIKDINFSTYNKGTEHHYMNILTTTADVPNVVWTDTAGVQHHLQNDFHPLYGNSEYSYARIEIDPGNHRLQGRTGFLAHVYGFGVNESYAYSCGSSTIQRSVTFNGEPLMIDSIYSGKFCLNEEIEMKLNIGNNDYESIVWNYGDGISEASDPNATNEEKKRTSHVYTTPGWYDLTVSAVYVNSCTGKHHNEDMHFAFRVVRPDTVYTDSLYCIPEDQSLPKDTTIMKDEGKCDTVYILHKHYAKKSTRRYSMTVKVTDGYEMHGHWYTDPYQEDTFYVGQNAAGCDSFEICQLTLKMCMVMDLPEKNLHICPDDPFNLAYTLSKGEMGEMRFISGSTNVVLNPSNGYVGLPTQNMKPGMYQAKITVQDLVCDTTLEFPLNMTVNYSREIFKFKFNNVLAVYNKEYNGGYIFTGYQWYYNGQPIEGANTSVYHSETPLEPGEYFVMLTDANGLTMPSCPQKIRPEDIPDYSDLGKAPATKHLINRQIVIRKGEQSYNIYGQRVE